MIILALRVNDLAHFPGTIERAHRMQILVKTGGLKHHIIASAAFHRRKQSLRLLERPKYRRHRAGDVLAMLQSFDAVPRVAGGIGGNKHSLYAIVLHQFLQ
jgi:hypothetical protein